MAVSPDDAEMPERLRTPMTLDAPAEAEDYEAGIRKDVKIDRLENQVRTLRSKIASRDMDDLNKFDAGVKHGRDAERRELADRLDRNAAALEGNGTAQDSVVRSVLKTLAKQLRMLAGEP